MPEESQSVEIPISACPDAKPGDMIHFKVVSVNSDGGVVNAEPVSETEEDSAENEGGSDKMAEDMMETEEEK